MSLYWGVQPIILGETINHEDELESAIKAVQKIENLPNGSRCIAIGGLAVGRAGSTSVLKIREMMAN